MVQVLQDDPDYLDEGEDQSTKCQGANMVSKRHKKETDIGGEIELIEWKANKIQHLILAQITECTKYKEHLFFPWQTDQVNPGKSYDPLLMSLVKSTSISVDEVEETG